MEGVTTQSEARRIMKDNFIGNEELLQIRKQFPVSIPIEVPEITFSKEFLLNIKDTHILILCVDKFENDDEINILNIRNHFFGISNDYSPRFYNQDWYLKEGFANLNLKVGWALLRKEVRNSSRGISPDELTLQTKFPSAVLSAYTFFVFFLCRDKILWKRDYIWCSDFDHNGDRIYVGKYHDDLGISQNGFSIHRHLKLKNNYGAIETL